MNLLKKSNVLCIAKAATIIVVLTPFFFFGSEKGVVVVEAMPSCQDE